MGRHATRRAGGHVYSARALESPDISRRMLLAVPRPSDSLLRVRGLASSCECTMYGGPDTALVQSENPRALSETGGTVPPAASGRPRLRPWAVSTPWALEEAGQAEGMLLWPSRADAILSRLACGHPHFGTKAVGAPGSRPAPHAAPLSSVGGAGLGGRPAPSARVKT